MVDQDTVAITAVATGLDHPAVGIGINGVTMVSRDIKTFVKTSLAGDGVNPPAVTAGDSFPLHDPVVYSTAPVNSSPGPNADDCVGRFL